MNRMSFKLDRMIEIVLNENKCPNDTYDARVWIDAKLDCLNCTKDCKETKKECWLHILDYLED